MFFNSMNTVKTDAMQPPQALTKTVSHLENNPLRASVSILSQKKVCAQESSNSLYSNNQNSLK
jgi:hypothetical protein